MTNISQDLKKTDLINESIVIQEPVSVNDANQNKIEGENKFSDVIKMKTQPDIVEYDKEKQELLNIDDIELSKLDTYQSNNDNFIPDLRQKLKDQSNVKDNQSLSKKVKAKLNSITDLRGKIEFLNKHANNKKNLQNPLLGILNVENPDEKSNISQKCSKRNSMIESRRNSIAESKRNSITGRNSSKLDPFRAKQQIPIEQLLNNQTIDNPQDETNNLKGDTLNSNLEKENEGYSPHKNCKTNLKSHKKQTIKSPQILNTMTVERISNEKLSILKLRRSVSVIDNEKILRNEKKFENQNVCTVPLNTPLEQSKLNNDNTKFYTDENNISYIENTTEEPEFQTIMNQTSDSIWNKNQMNRTFNNPFNDKFNPMIYEIITDYNSIRRVSEKKTAFLKYNNTDLIELSNITIKEKQKILNYTYQIDTFLHGLENTQKNFNAIKNEFLHTNITEFSENEQEIRIYDNISPSISKKLNMKKFGISDENSINLNIKENNSPNMHILTKLSEMYQVPNIVPNSVQQARTPLTLHRKKDLYFPQNPMGKTLNNEFLPKLMKNRRNLQNLTIKDGLNNTTDFNKTFNNKNLNNTISYDANIYNVELNNFQEHFCNNSGSIICSPRRQANLNKNNDDNINSSQKHMPMNSNQFQAKNSPRYQANVRNDPAKSIQVKSLITRKQVPRKFLMPYN